MPHMTSSASFFYPIFEQISKKTTSKFGQNLYNKDCDFFFFFFFFFLIWVLRPFQEYFTYIEPIHEAAIFTPGLLFEKS